MKDKIYDHFITFYIQFLYDIWQKMGIDGELEQGRLILDPEPLFIYSLPILRYNFSFFQKVVNWLATNNEYIYIKRLKNILSDFLYGKNPKEKDLYNRVVAAIFEKISVKNYQKFKNLHSFIKKYKNNNKKYNFLLEGNINTIDEDFNQFGVIINEVFFDNKDPIIPNNKNGLRFMIRALFSIENRAEIILYLITHEKSDIRKLSEVSTFTKKAVKNILNNLTLSTLININYSGDRIPFYTIANDRWWNLFFGYIPESKEKPVYLNWIRFLNNMESIRIALEKDEKKEMVYGLVQNIINDLKEQKVIKKVYIKKSMEKKEIIKEFINYLKEIKL